MDSMSEKPTEAFDWNADTEVQLFHAMRGHKPVGVNRYFQMACIHEKFSASLNKDIASQTIWDHLDTMYDMAALHESEILPFPNNENEFVLPDNDFGDLLSKRREKSSTDKECTKRAPSPAARSSTGGKSRLDDSTAPRKPETTGGKTQRSGGKSKSDTSTAASRKSDTGMPKHNQATSRVKPEHAHGKVKNDSTPSQKSSRLEPPASGLGKPHRAESSSKPSKSDTKSSKASDAKSESKNQEVGPPHEKHKQSRDSSKGSKGESKADSKAESKTESKAESKAEAKGDHPKAEPKGGGGSKGDSSTAGTKRNEPSKAKDSNRKTEGRGKAEDDNTSTSAKGSSRQVKEEPQESAPKRKRTSRLDTPKSNSSQVAKSRRR
uniref:Putative chromatin modification-related protein eaf7 n=1 Tax=Amblyomma aureolatum TaxID=187763 RepID=A0A1E1XA89_9ACAR